MKEFKTPVPTKMQFNRYVKGQIALDKKMNVLHRKIMFLHGESIVIDVINESNKRQSKQKV
jgi:hypothetical protein